MVEDQEEEPLVPVIDGIYGTSGFYFQQRRGRLDIRALSQIDIERLVRDVDIDLLQMNLENLTFCNLREEDLRFLTDQNVVKLFRMSQLTIEYLLYAQEQLSGNLNALAAKYTARKRSLLRKRKELEELTESTKSLKSQLKAKKKALEALEATMRSAKRKMRAKPREESPEPPKIVVEPPRKLTTKFFIAANNGTCIEFDVLGGTSVKYLKKESLISFLSKQERDEHGREPNIKLFHHGKLLPDDYTVDQANIHDNDTIVAVIEYEEQKEAPRVEPANVNKEMFDFLAKQQELMAAEMRNGWQGVMQTLSLTMQNNLKPENPDILRAVDDRLSLIKDALKNQFDAQFNLLKENSRGPKYIIGELEDDNDDKLLSRHEWEMKLRASNSKIQGLEDKLGHSQLTVEEMKRLIDQQRYEIEELKKKMDAKNLIQHQIFVNAQQQQQPSPVEKREPETKAIDTVAAQQKPVSKWKQVAGAADSSSKKEGAKVQAQQVFEAPKVAEKPKPVETPKAAPKPKEDKIKIIFPYTYNKHLPFLKAREDITIPPMDRNLKADDILHTIRQFIATKAQQSLAKVLLELDQNPISLGVDVEEATFTVEEAAKLAQAGRLVIALLNENPITDAQIDALLVSQWEQSKFDKAAVANKSNDKSQKRMEQTLRTSYVLSDSEGEKVDETEKNANKIRQSLKGVLSDVSDKEGLSDIELQKKMKILKDVTADAPKRMSEYIDDYRGNLVGKVNQAVDSESEDASKDTRKSNSLRLSRNSTTGQFNATMPSPLRKPRNYADIDDDITLTASLNRDLRLLQASRSSSDRERNLDSSDYDSDYKRPTPSSYAQRPIDKSPTTKNSSFDKASPKLLSSQSRQKYIDDKDDYKDHDHDDDIRTMGSEDSNFDESKSYFDTQTNTQTMSTVEGSLFDETADVSKFDFDKTVNTDISMPGDSLNETSEIRRRADEYQKHAARQLHHDRNPMTPPMSNRSDRKPLSSGAPSPFDHLVSEYDDKDSLLLSESNETFGDFDQSSRSDVRY